MKKLLLLLLVLLPCNCFAGNWQRSFFYPGQFIQIKEAANYGLVFSGPSAGLGFQASRHWGKNSFVYENSLALGLPFARNLMGVNFMLQPAHVVYSRELAEGNPALWAGGFFRVQYDVQFYPGLQSGFQYWLTQFSPGISIGTAFSIPAGTIGLSMSGSVAGFTSRTGPYTNPYFFDLSPGQVLRNAHRGLRYSGPRQYLNASLQLGYQANKQSRTAVFYHLDYADLKAANRLQILRHSIRLVVKTKAAGRP